MRLWNRLRGSGHSTAQRPHGAGCERYFEMSVGSVNAAVSDEAFARGWAAFFEELDKELLASPATKKQRV